MRPAKWRITSIKQRKSLDSIFSPSTRVTADPQLRISCKKLQEIDRRDLTQTYRPSNRYNSTQLQLKIRSRIVSVKKIELSPQKEYESLAIPPKSSPTESSGYKRRYLFNFYHKSKQLAVRRPNRQIKA